jgi:hypothetical protein
MAKQTFTTGQVLTAAEMTSLQQTAMGGGSATAKTASYTLVAADAGTTVIMNSGSATTITVNTSLFAAGDTVFIVNQGAGVCTITAGTATVSTAGSLVMGENETGQLYFLSASAAIFSEYTQAAGTGGMTLLSTTTLSGATTTISSINQTYNSLFLLVTGVSNASNYAFTGRPNSSATISSEMLQVGTNATTTNVAVNNQDIYLSWNSIAASNTNNAWAITIDNYASTTNYKPLSYSGGWFTSTSVNEYGKAGGFIQTNSAITEFQFTASAGSFNGGTVRIYGVK